METDWKLYRDNAFALLRSRKIIPITGDICKELKVIVLDCLSEALIKGYSKLTVLFNSNGGEWQSGVAIHNSLALASANGINTTGIVLSRANSAAIVILQACTKRIVCPGSMLIMHWGRSTLSHAEQDAIMQGPYDWVI